MVVVHEVVCVRTDILPWYPATSEWIVDVVASACSFCEVISDWLAVDVPLKVEDSPLQHHDAATVDDAKIQHFCSQKLRFI